MANLSTSLDSDIKDYALLDQQKLHILKYILAKGGVGVTLICGKRACTADIGASHFVGKVLGTLK